VLSFVCCAESVAVWPATFALTRLVTSDDTSSDELPVDPLMMDCAADASAAWVAAMVAAAEAAAVLDALDIVDIEMLRTSVLLSSLNDKLL
jgi:hypothetical protein